jgi:hypothetical protein
MKRVGHTNNPNFPVDEWSRQTVDLGELFDIPNDLTQEEIGFARGLMETLKIETDDDENLIELISRPSDFMSFLVHVKRISNQHEKISFFR